MKVTYSEISLLIIAGGKSSRMGSDKRQLLLEGLPLLEQILLRGQGAGFKEILLCAETEFPFLRKLTERYGAVLVSDELQGRGPMEGLAQGLFGMRTDWGMAVAADLPFLEFNALKPMLNMISERTRAVLPMVNGRRQPLAAFYHREMVECFRQALSEDRRKIGEAIDSVPCELFMYSGPMACFFNVNTPADLRLARGRAANLKRRIPVIAVTAPVSGTGKTTFIERLLPRLRGYGIRAGVVKSDSHGLELDMEGKDSWRFRRAGAQSVAVVAPGGWLMVQQTESPADFLAVAEKMEAVDLILTESRTHGTLPAISLWRGKGNPQTGPEIAALFSSEPELSQNLCQYHIDDMEKAVEVCLFLMGR